MPGRRNRNPGCNDMSQGSSRRGSPRIVQHPSEEGPVGWPCPSPTRAPDAASDNPPVTRTAVRQHRSTLLGIMVRAGRPRDRRRNSAAARRFSSRDISLASGQGSRFPPRPSEATRERRSACRPPGRITPVLPDHGRRPRPIPAPPERLSVRTRKLGVHHDAGGGPVVEREVNAKGRLVYRANHMGEKHHGRLLTPAAESGRTVGRP
jgi:hypothetical protein